MPSSSKKQHNFMEMVAHNPKMAKKVGVPQSVGKEFVAADKGKKFNQGGLPERINKPKAHHTEGGAPNMSIKRYAGFKGGGMAKDMESKSEMKKEMAADKKQDIAMIKKAFKEHDAQEHKGGKGTKLTLKKGGAIKEAAIGSAKMGSVKTSAKRDGIAQRGHTKGRVC
jgi:hypothetical protein